MLEYALDLMLFEYAHRRYAYKTINMHSCLDIYMKLFRQKKGKTQTWESNMQKLFGIVSDGNLNFNGFFFNMCKKAMEKLSVLEK